MQKNQRKTQLFSFSSFVIILDVAKDAQGLIGNAVQRNLTVASTGALTEKQGNNFVVQYR